MACGKLERNKAHGTGKATAPVAVMAIQPTFRT